MFSHVFKVMLSTVVTVLILKVIADHPISSDFCGPWFMTTWPTLGRTKFGTFDPGRRQRAKRRRSCWLSCDSSSLVPPDGWSSHPADHWLHQVTAGYCRCRSAWEKLRKHLNIGLGILRLALTSAFYAFVRDSVDSVYLVLEHVKSKICQGDMWRCSKSWVGHGGFDRIFEAEHGMNYELKRNFPKSASASLSWRWPAFWPRKEPTELRPSRWWWVSTQLWTKMEGKQWV